MKKVKTLLIGVILSLSIIATPVCAAKNPYNATNSLMGSSVMNCTYFAWQQAYNRAGVALPSWGNASTWYESARKAGFEVGKTPKAKSIVVWSWVWKGKDYGHVGYVEKVVGDKIYVWDSDKTCTDREDPDYKNCISNSMDQAGDEACFDKYAKTTACEYSASYWSSPGDLIGYIYLDNVPATTKKTTNTTTKKTTEKTTTTKAKSNNTYLKSITLSDGILEFDKEITEYEIEVENEVESIKIDAITEDNLSTIDLKPEYSLNKGTNKIEFVVTAEDGTKATYLIKVNRKGNDQEEFAKVKVENVVKKKQNNTTLYIVVGSFAIIIIALLIVIINVIRQKKRNKTDK